MGSSRLSIANDQQIKKLCSLRGSGLDWWSGDAAGPYLQLSLCFAEASLVFQWW
jgi:hypothetical protein